MKASNKVKAKSIKTGKWIEGYYVCLNNQSHRIYTGYAEKDVDDYYPDWEEIDKETLCYSTGLSEYYGDGVTIFTHDIIEISYRGESILVEVIQEPGEFLLVSDVFPDGYATMTEYICSEGGVFYLLTEIKGNTIDNPELLQKTQSPHR